MRFGCCVALASFVPPTSGAGQLDAGEAYEASVAQVPRAIEVLEAAGCEFMEFGVGMTAPELPESAFRAFRRALERTELVAECFNSYVPPSIPLVGEGRDWAKIVRHVRITAERVAAVGGEIIVFGSGAARSIPDGFPRETAETQLVEFLELAAEHANKNGIRIAIEPLNRKESNVWNTVAEALETVKALDRPEIGVLADFYHIDEEQEPFANVAAADGHLLHVHVADTGRLYPGSGSYDYPGFYAALDEAGYDARISIECNWRDFASEVPAAMTFLRESYAAFREGRG